MTKGTSWCLNLQIFFYLKHLCHWGKSDWRISVLFCWPGPSIYGQIVNNFWIGYWTPSEIHNRPIWWRKSRTWGNKIASLSRRDWKVSDRQASLFMIQIIRLIEIGRCHSLSISDWPQKNSTFSCQSRSIIVDLLIDQFSRHCFLGSPRCCDPDRQLETFLGPSRCTWVFDEW